MFMSKKIFTIHQKFLAPRTKIQRGLTLIELMIGMTIGLVISAGALTMFSSTFSANAAAINIARVNDEVNDILQIVTRELRRAGFNNGQEPQNFNVITVGNVGAGVNNCILYSWDENSDNVVDNTERRGFRLNGSVVEWRKSDDAAPSCNNSTGWFAMNSANIATITSLTFTTTATPCSIVLQIQARSTKDASIVFDLTDEIVSRNIESC
jgi:prepilin peptidase dependent protein B